MTDPLPAIRYDHAGGAIRLPARSSLTYERYAELVEALTPDCCSYPDGKRLDPRTKEPCRRERISECGCEYHAGQKAAREMRYGRFLPKRIRKVLALAATDQELLNIGHDVALVSARLHELQARLDTGESGAAWDSLQELWSDFITANQMAQRCTQNEDKLGAKQWLDKAAKITGQIGKVIKSGSENENTWRDIIECSTLLSRLKMSETQRRREAGQVLDVEQAYLFVDKINNVILDNVKDTGTRNRIATQIAIALGIAGIRSSRGGVVVDAPVAEVTQEPKQTARRRLSVDDLLGE